METFQRIMTYAVEDDCICYGEYDSLEEAQKRIQDLILEDLIVLPNEPGQRIASHRYGIVVRFEQRIRARGRK